MASSVTMRSNMNELDAMLHDLSKGKYNKEQHTGHALQQMDYFSDFEETTSYSALPTNDTSNKGRRKEMLVSFNLYLLALCI